MVVLIISSIYPQTKLVLWPAYHAMGHFSVVAANLMNKCIMTDGKMENVIKRDCELGCSNRMIMY